MESTMAILLRKTKLTETSLIITWYSELHGKVKTVAKGARSQKSRFAGMLDLFHRCEIQYRRSRTSELHSLRDAMLVEPYGEIRFDYPRLALAAYFVEALDLATPPEQAAPELFDLLQRALGFLQKKPASRKALLHFEAELAGLLGIEQPGVSAARSLAEICHASPKSRQVAESLLQA